MKKRKFPGPEGGLRFLALLTACLIAFSVVAKRAEALTKIPALTGLSAAVGAALDSAQNRLYFVEYGSGELKRTDLPPQCGMATTPACSTTVAVIATGFSHPEDVELDLGQGLAYVTTRDEPGTSGSLWRVQIATGIKTLVTFNLGAPQQLVLDLANQQAYTVGYSDGRLRRVDLTTGAKTPLFVGLEEPVGLAISVDGGTAYVTEQRAPARLSQIDLTLGVKTTDLVTDGLAGNSLVAPFFLAWSDMGRSALYLVERDPANRVARVDLATGVKQDVLTDAAPPDAWWWRPTGLVVGSAGTPLLVTTDQAVVHVDLGLDLSEPGFMGVGHVPISKIDAAGYATTDPGYFFEVKNAPFGGSMNIFANLSNFQALGASTYEISVAKDGGPAAPLDRSWNSYRWNPTDAEYQLTSVAPLPATTRYAIPPEYPLNAGWWYPPFLSMRWPSGENGLYTFSLRLYNAGGVDITPAGLPEMTLRVDNTPPTVNIQNIYQHKPPVTDIEPCVIVNNGNNQFTFKVTANDAEGHLYNYHLTAMYGDNQRLGIASDSYDNHVTPPPPPYSPVAWHGVVNQIVPAAPIGMPCNCAYTFYLGAWGRTINGYNRIQYVDYHKSITVDLPTLSTCTIP